jgi:hypothetical protein
MKINLLDKNFSNVFKEVKEMYPKITDEEIVNYICYIRERN